MTAIAGCVGTSGRSPCARILRAQSAFGGSKESLAALGAATFGIDLRPVLPEDEFDRQPLITGDRFLIVADIRIDNRDELLSELGMPGQGKSDSDLLLGCWSRWQEQCLERITGDYSFAIWDQARQELTLARDPTGQRPLFYGHNGDQVAFSTTAAGLLAWPVLVHGFNHARLAARLLDLARENDESYFQNIFRVHPGCLVTIGRRVAQRRHWLPPQDELRLPDVEDYVEAYSEGLRTAVRARLRRTGGPVGVQLSSGWDSSAVAATAAQLSASEKPIAFTYGPQVDAPAPRNRFADETELAALTASMHGLEHVIIRPTGKILANLRSHARLYQEPSCNIVNMQWLSQILGAAEARGVTVLLNGHMGNLTVNAGGLPVLAEWMRRGALIEWWREGLAAVHSGQARWRGVLMNSFEPALPEGTQRWIYRTFAGVPALAVQSFVREEWFRKALATPGAQPSVDGYDGRYAHRFHQVAGTDVGVFRKGALAESGIDERDPTADRRLLDFSFKLPPEQLLHRGEWKPLARRALTGLIPPGMLNAKQRGYQGADWYERLTKADALAVLEEISASHATTELLDLKKIHAAIDRWPTGGWAEPRTVQIYRTRIPVALAAGVFLQEFEASMTGASAESG